MEKRVMHAGATKFGEEMRQPLAQETSTAAMASHGGQCQATHAAHRPCENVRLECQGCREPYKFPNACLWPAFCHAQEARRQAGSLAEATGFSRSTQLRTAAAMVSSTVRTRGVVAWISS